MLLELSELQSANNNWDYVASDNRLVKLALYIQEIEGINVKPDDFIKIIDLWNPDTLIGLNNVCNQIEMLIASNATQNKKLEKISKTVKIFWETPDYTKEETLALDRAQVMAGQKLTSHILKMSNDVIANSKLVCDKMYPVPFSAAVLSYNEYFIITTMRMLRWSCPVWNTIPIW